MKEHLAAYRSTLSDLGRPWPPVRALARDLYIANSDDEAWQDGAEILWRRHRSYGLWGMDRDMMEVDRLDLPLVAMARGRFIIGSPESCQKQLQSYIEGLDTNYLLLRVQNPGVAQQVALHAIRLLGEEVLPALRHLPTS